jgi:hypothetical protein
MINYTLWPISLLLKDYIHFVPFYLGRSIPFYFFFVMIIYGLVKRNMRFHTDIITKKFTIVLLLLLILQLLSMAYSHYTINIERYNYGVKSPFISLILFICSIFVFYLSIRMNIWTEKEIKQFLKGGIGAIAIALFVSYLQIFYLFLPGAFKGIIEIFGKYFETRWHSEVPGEPVHRFYTFGSYVQTTQRVNGITQEASTNAQLFSIVFIPFLLASIRNRYNIFTQRKNMALINALLFLTIGVLLMGRTSMGIAESLIILIILFKDISIIKKFIITLVSVVGLLFLVGYGINAGFISNILYPYLNKVSDIGNFSTANRFGNTIALLQTIITHPFGVGRGYLNYYIFEYLPNWSRNNIEYDLWVKTWFPILSANLGAIAEFGIWIFVIFGIYVVRSLKRWKKVISILSLEHPQFHFIQTLADSYKYFLILSCFGSFFALEWFSSVYIVIFFFFITSLLVLESIYNEDTKEKLS